MNQKFFAPIRAVFSLFLLFLFTASAFATDPVKTDPGTSTFVVSVSQSDELGDYLRNIVNSLSATQQKLWVTTDQQNQTITYRLPGVVKLHDNEFETTMIGTFSLSNAAEIQSLTIWTESRLGTQEFLIVPKSQLNLLKGPGQYTSATAPSIVTKLNQKLRLSEYEPYAIQTNQLESQQSAETDLTKPKQQTSRSGANKTQR